MKNLQRFWQCEAGNAVEYVLIVALVSLVIFSGAGLLGVGLSRLFRVATSAFGWG